MSNKKPRVKKGKKQLRMYDVYAKILYNCEHKVQYIKWYDICTSDNNKMLIVCYDDLTADKFYINTFDELFEAIHIVNQRLKGIRANEVD